MHPPKTSLPNIPMFFIIKSLQFLLIHIGCSELWAVIAGPPPSLTNKEQSSGLRGRQTANCVGGSERVAAKQLEGEQRLTGQNGGKLGTGLGIKHSSLSPSLSLSHTHHTQRYCQ
jgi:hypothetical protein